MSAIRKSFYYSPIRQGYDTNIWSTVYGTPALVVGGRFTVSSSAGVRGSVIHYADFVKGDLNCDSIKSEITNKLKPLEQQLIQMGYKKS